MHELRRRLALIAVLCAPLACADGERGGAPNGPSAGPGVAVEPGVSARPGVAAGASVSGASVAASGGSPRACLNLPVGEAGALRCWVEWLAAPALAGRAAGSPGGTTARTGIEAVLRNLYLEPAGVGGFTQALPRGANVLGRVPGRDPTRTGEVVVFGAHFDHLGERGGARYLGADDNASGVAVLLEVTRRLIADPPARSVLVAAFDAEEPPAYLSEAMGSAYFVAHPTVPRAQMVAMVAMDLMGGNLWPGARTPMFVMGRETLANAGGPTPGPGAVETRAMHLRLVEELPGGRQAFSDHGAFFAAQTPVLLFSSGRSPHYHRVTDLPETLDYEKLAGAVVVVEGYLRWLADLPERPAWRADAPVTAADAAAVADLLAAGSAAGGSPELTGMAKPIVRDDLARMRRLSAGDRQAPLSEADARAVIAVSLRMQCLLTPDDEAPTATCLML